MILLSHELDVTVMGILGSISHFVKDFDCKRWIVTVVRVAKHLMKEKKHTVFYSFLHLE